MTDSAERTRKQRGGLTKTAWNERIKLLATTLNGVGLAIFGFDVLAPAFSRAAPLDVVQGLVCTIMFIGLPVWAQWFLRGLED